MTLIERIKEELTLEACLDHFGVEVPPRGRDPVMVRCPWHEDKTRAWPSIAGRAAPGATPATGAGTPWI